MCLLQCLHCTRWGPRRPKQRPPCCSTILDKYIITTTNVIDVKACACKPGSHEVDTQSSPLLLWRAWLEKVWKQGGRSSEVGHHVDRCRRTTGRVSKHRTSALRTSRTFVQANYSFFTRWSFLMFFPLSGCVAWTCTLKSVGSLQVSTSVTSFRDGRSTEVGQIFHSGVHALDFERRLSELFCGLYSTLNLIFFLSPFFLPFSLAMVA